MASTKRITGDYSIVSDDGAGNSGTITLDATGTGGLVLIPGSLTVSGTLTAIDTVNLEITDNTILLNAGETGPGVSLTTAGVEIDRGGGTDNAFILYNEPTQTWLVDFGDGAGLIHEIVTGAIGAPSGMQDLIDDLTPQVGGVVGLDMRDQDIVTSDLSSGLAITLPAGNVNTITFTASNAASNIVLAAGNDIRLESPVIVATTTDPGATAAGEVALYQAADAGGGTQLFYRNDTDTGELVSKTKAMVFGLIF